MRHQLRVLTIALLAALGCSDGTAPAGNAVPIIIGVPPSAPPLWQSTVSFYAKRGEDREGSLYFQGAAGGPGDRFARLRIGAASLLARPDGTPIALGDSVLITVRPVSASQLLIELDPGGLQFDPADPAILEMSYAATGGDLDGDGQVSQADTLIAGRLAIWRQAVAGAPFVPLPSTRLPDLEEVTAQLNGFSRYALAY